MEQPELAPIPWDGQERRSYCAEHCRVAADIKAGTPWKFFVAYNAVLILIITAMAYWSNEQNEAVKSDVDQFRITVNTKIVKIETDYQRELMALRERYRNDLDRLLNKVDFLTGEVSVIGARILVVKDKQDMVLEKIKITE